MGSEREISIPGRLLATRADRSCDPDHGHCQDCDPHEMPRVVLLMEARYQIRGSFR
jgi:hypothetical protein